MFFVERHILRLYDNNFRMTALYSIQDNTDAKIVIKNNSTNTK